MNPYECTRIVKQDGVFKTDRFQTDDLLISKEVQYLHITKPL